jgi:hypothetical protein
MPNTPGGFPYPDPTARPDVPADIEALARQVDARLGNLRILAGTVNVTATASSVTGAATVNFPADSFASTPRVVCQVTGSTLWTAVMGAAGSAGSFAVQAREITGATGNLTLNVNWVAIGVAP